jgi:hypothetical protein
MKSEFTYIHIHIKGKGKEVDSGLLKKECEESDTWRLQRWSVQARDACVTALNVGERSLYDGQELFLLTSVLFQRYL